jgi:outer membrane receptor protein involved in Fe transport
VFDVPQAVSVVDSAQLAQSSVSSVVQLLPALPGVDLIGAGANQLQPSIRGQRGQRILLLENGLRLNNPRRQSDFGELPAVIDFNTLDRVEIVRGPSSVLYGSDAIGGVMNLIGNGLPWGTEGRLVHGAARFGFVSNETSEVRPSGSIVGRQGRLAFRADATYRNADDYSAPSGKFGDVELDRSVTVHATGVEDRNIGASLGYAFSDQHRVFARYGNYLAEDAGFGYVDPDDYASDGTRVEILYPHQVVNRVTAGYTGRNLNSTLFDRLDVAAYGEDNERNLHQNIFVPLSGGPFLPGDNVDTRTRNFTDVETFGGRVEAARLLGGRHNLTYGFDISRDRTFNTDSSITVFTATVFGPPDTTVSTTPNVPNAQLRMFGLFTQFDWAVSSRFSLVLGARYQDNKAETRSTEGLDEPLIESTDRTVVGAANALYALTPDLNLVAAVGRGFRSPNLIERFFSGPTPEGSGFQIANPDLDAETSLNLDLGLRLRKPTFFVEGFVFRNAIEDGIRVAATGDSTGGQPVFQTVNVDETRVWGVEVGGQVVLAGPFILSGNVTWFDEENVDEPLLPVSDTYRSKVNGALTYRAPSGRFWLAGTVRYQGEQDNIELGSSPVGETMPAFTVFGLDGGVRVAEIGRTRHTLIARVENVGDVLYAEAGNTGFFRPSAGRRLHVGWTSEF